MDGDDALPQFEIAFDLSAGGVLSNVRLDYGEFTLKADLEKLETFAPAGLPLGRSAAVPAAQKRSPWPGRAFGDRPTAMTLGPSPRAHRHPRIAHAGSQRVPARPCVGRTQLRAAGAR